MVKTVEVAGSQNNTGSCFRTSFSVRSLEAPGFKESQLFFRISYINERLDQLNNAQNFPNLHTSQVFADVMQKCNRIFLDVCLSYPYLPRIIELQIALEASLSEVEFMLRKFNYNSRLQRIVPFSHEDVVELDEILKEAIEKILVPFEQSQVK